ncbi:MAG: hypothetical protein GXP15_10190 [Gammaproteobacteria bacterium]|nr:hypothetical protein [Gammaproteobacteria bacterium]
MERLIQYLDILEDAWYVVALLAERIRRIALQLGIFAIMAVAIALGVTLALNVPPLGFAVAALLTVTVLYRSATARTFALPQS